MLFPITWGRNLALLQPWSKKHNSWHNQKRKNSRSSIKLFGQYPCRPANYSENGVENMFAVSCSESILLFEIVPCDWVRVHELTLTYCLKLKSVQINSNWKRMKFLSFA
jgi:hypothetical protein